MTMLVDDVPEYQDMRKALLELRKELSTSMADDILTRCEKAIHAIRDASIQDTLANTKETAAVPEMLATLQDTANSLEAVSLWLDSIGQKEKAKYIREINSRNRAAIAKAKGDEDENSI